MTTGHDEGTKAMQLLDKGEVCQQEARMEVDPWEDVLASHLAALVRRGKDIAGFVGAVDEAGDPEWRVSTSYLLASVLDLPKSRFRKS
jgi:hypothetical protein